MVRLWKKANWTEVACRIPALIEKVGGIFLITGKEGQSNIMTIGWAQTGRVWGRPMATALVRPSRFTFEKLKEHPFFVIALPTEDMYSAIQLCGSVSGREGNKFQKAGLSTRHHQDFPVPSIEECVGALFCQVIQETKVDPATFPQHIIQEYYPQGDFHHIYFGEIIKAELKT